MYLRKNTVENNRMIWNERHKWSKDGDEWDGQAIFSGQPYDKWKQSLVDNFIHNNIDEETIVLEIAPGHGRWTESMIKKAKEIILVDLSPSCIEFCKDKFSKFQNISYHVNDGRTLSFIKDNSVNFVWSYDSFVHMDRDVIQSYFSEFSRVLKPYGKAIIHHAGRRNMTLGLGFLIGFGKAGRYIYQVLSLGKTTVGDGWRSNISKELIAETATRSHLVLEDQVNSWGPESEYNCRRFRDYISILVKQ